MSGSPPEGLDAAAIDRLYREKARAELRAADALVRGAATPVWAGDELAHVALVKGVPGPADVEAGRTLAGADAEAATKALVALDLPEAWFAICSRVGAGSARTRTERLRLALEAVDPRVIVALDAEAAADVAAAFGLEPLAFGTLVSFGGRAILAVDGFEASLSDARRKRRVWQQLRSLKSPGTHDGRP